MNKYNRKWVLKFAPRGEIRWAITLGQTTYYSVSDVGQSWMNHENCHKRQWAKEGVIKFAIKYLWYQITKGYTNNPYEIEARKAEKANG
jgi:hypothetical protein